jgi:hypothetical protein
MAAQRLALAVVVVALRVRIPRLAAQVVAVITQRTAAVAVAAVSAAQAVQQTQLQVPMVA